MPLRSLFLAGNSRDLWLLSLSLALPLAISIYRSTSLALYFSLPLHLSVFFSVVLRRRRPSLFCCCTIFSVSLLRPFTRSLVRWVGHSFVLFSSRLFFDVGGGCCLAVGFYANDARSRLFSRVPSWLSSLRFSFVRRPFAQSSFSASSSFSRRFVVSSRRLEAHSSVVGWISFNNL